MPLTIMCSISGRIFPQYSCFSRMCFQNDAEACFLWHLWKTERNAILPPHRSVLSAHVPESHHLLLGLYDGTLETALPSSPCREWYEMGDWDEGQTPREKDRMCISVCSAPKQALPTERMQRELEIWTWCGFPQSPPHPWSLGDSPWQLIHLQDYLENVFSSASSLPSSFSRFLPLMWAFT